MPIAHDRKIVFIHIPKTGGTSISSHFFDFEDEKTIKYDKDCLLSSMISIGDGKYRRASHCTAQEIRNLHPEVFESYQKITVVRNPFDKIVSEYYHFLQMAHNIPMIGHVKDMTFSDFVSRLYDKFDEIQELQTLKREDYYIHVVPQVHFLKIDGKISDQIKVYRFENFREIRDQLGITRKLNVNCLKDYAASYQKHYDSRLVQKVNQMYEEDLRVFNYSFGDKT